MDQKLINIYDYNGQLVTSSLNVAEVTEKRHDHVMRDIERLIEKGSNRPNFGAVEFFIEAVYVDAKGESRKMYLLTRKGTAWLINRYTGDNAVDFQLAYIERFEEMEQQIAAVQKLMDQGRPTQTKMQESVDVIKAKMEIYALFAVPVHLAQIESVKMAKLMTGVDHSEALQLAPAQDHIEEEDVMLEPKELEIQLGLGSSGQKMNRILEALGLQSKINSEWVPTDKAKGLFCKHAWSKNGKSGYNYKWQRAAIKDFVKNLMDLYGSIDQALIELNF